MKGWLPQCTVKVTNVNPASWNTYRIEWSRQGFAAYVNSNLAGTCAINGFDQGEIQLWADNYLLPNLWTLDQLNPSGAQHSFYRTIRVWYEPVAP